MSTRAEIDLDAVRHNLKVLHRYAGRSRVWPVIKADAYGHGLLPIARTLEAAGADGFCVDRVMEAIALRDAGVRARILLMGSYDLDACAEIAGRGVLPVISNAGQLEALDRAARTLGTNIAAHVKIDTGMSRLGIGIAELERFAERAAVARHVRITGLMTHFACADAPPDAPEAAFTTEQIARFEEATIHLTRAGVGSEQIVRHAANSAAVLRGQGLFDLVRPGLAVYGISPVPLTHAELRPVLRVRTTIIDVRDIKPGESVGYGARYRVQRSARIATAAFGYADGLLRHLGNRGHVLVRGRRAPIVGAVSMSMSSIDVTSIDGASVGDEVIVLGAQAGPDGEVRIDADEVARAADTIPWEVLTSLSRDLPRIYLEESRPANR